MNKLIITLIILIITSCSRTPEQMFNAIFDKTYESVKVIDGQDQMILDCCIWLHFNVSESDFNLIFHDFEIKETDYSQWDGLVPPGMKWWTPSNFKNRGKYKEKISEDGRITEGIYFNDNKNEVYYVNWYN